MALISQAGPSHCFPSETVQYKTGHYVAINMANIKGASSISWKSAKTRQVMHLDNMGIGRKRGHRAIVAASPPTEDAVIDTEPLTKEDLVGYLASGCKPKENWRIGTEHEKFGFELATLRPMKYEQISELLNGIAERFDWD